MSESVRTPPPGTGTLVAGRYRLDSVAGSGGMAQVWSATDTTLNRRVAVKVLHAHLRADSLFVDRFRQEARTAAKLHHHALIAIYDTVADDAVDAIVMELVEGETLRARLDRDRRLDPVEAVRIVVEVAGALDAAHRLGLTHRDIKPANILLCNDGSVKVADFGIAKGEGDLDLTQDGTMIGTAGYLSPEQIEGLPVDGRADQFAVGVVLYEMLCGRLPFAGDSETARALARLHQVPTPPSELVAEVTPGLSACVMRSLARSRDHRYGSMAEMGAALDAELHSQRVPAVVPIAPPRRPGADTGRVTKPSQVAKPARPARDRRWLGTTVLVALIGGALLLIAALVRDTTDERQNRDAPEVSGELSLIPIQSVTPFDPEGEGRPGENDSTAPLTHDGNVETAWRSERYRQPDFGVKSGVGLMVQLDRTAVLDRLDIDSDATGWSAQVFVYDGDPPTTAPTGSPLAVIDEATGDASVDLAGASGNTVLVWFVGLGDGDGRYRVTVNELRVVGTAE